MIMTRKDWVLVLLSFVGTLLGVTGAFMLDSWKENRKIQISKSSAAQQIQEEIENNLLELDTSYQEMVEIQWALEILSLEEVEGSLVIHPDTMNKLQSLNRVFYEITDIVEQQDGLVEYFGISKVSMDYVTLSKIAWETSTTMNILGEFSYDCLFVLEDTYNLQEITQAQFDKVVESLGASDLEGLAKNINLLIQFQESLRTKYNGLLIEIDQCK
jgi:hypothetical protein